MDCRTLLALLLSMLTPKATSKTLPGGGQAPSDADHDREEQAQACNKSCSGSCSKLDHCMKMSGTHFRFKSLTPAKRLPGEPGPRVPCRPCSLGD